MDGFDGIKLCENCGEYCTGRLCTSCAQQEQIDNDDLSGYYYADDVFDYDDEYDRYEDYVQDTGNDYLGMFDDDHELTRLQSLKRALKCILRGLKHHVRWLLSAKYRRLCDEIPF